MVFKKMSNAVLEVKIRDAISCIELSKTQSMYDTATIVTGMIYKSKYSSRVKEMNILRVMRIIIKYNLLEASNNYTVNQKANPLDRRPVPATRDEVKTVTILKRQGVIEIQETPALPRKAVFPSKVNRLNSL